MNGDGRADLVVANANGPSISILLGQTDGTFGAKSDFTVPQAPLALVTGDFNGDGKIDVAVTVLSGVAVLLGNGDGSLAIATTYPFANAPSFLSVADFNHDGKLDIVLAGACGNTCGFVSILLGNGDGTFKTVADVSAGGVPSAMAVSDFNGDGVLDLALANMVSNSVSQGTGAVVSVLLGNGDGSFKAAVNYASGANIAGIAAGDVTGDKVPDLVATHFGGTIVTRLTGNGDGTFQPEQQVSVDFSLGSAFLQLLDVNQDGKLDLVESSVDNSGLAVLQGNGDGTFQLPEVYLTGGQPYFFTVADVNGDGNVDLVVDDTGGFVTILLGNGDGRFSPRKNLLSDPQAGVNAAVVGDFNGDGTPDIAVSTQSGLKVSLGAGKGSFEAPTSTSLPSLVTYLPLAKGDFNHDGHLDVVVAGTMFYPGRGDGTFGTPVTVNNDSQIRSFVAGDFNGDGNLDLLDVGNGFFESQPIQMLLGNGDGTFQPARRSWSLSSIPDRSITGDFNGDGKLDLAVTVNPNGVAILLGNGDGDFAAPVLYATDDLPNGLTAADVNGDGILDLIATGTGVDVLLGKGDGTFSPFVAYAITGFPQQVATGDFNGDGKLDIAVTGDANGPGYLGILFGKGDGTFATPLVFTDYAPVGAPVVVADLNGDGVDDLFVAAEGGSLFLSSPLSSVSPSLVDFGSLATGAQSSSQSITITNVGNGPLTITSATTAAPFSIASPVCASALSRLGQCEIPVAFDPSASGPANGQVVIAENVANTSPVVALKGMAVTPILTLSPTALSFSAQAINTSSTAQTVTLTNTSSVAIAIASVVAQSPFAATSQCGSSIAANASCTISVVFTPTSAGQQTGSLVLSDSVAGSPQSIALSGSGAAALSFGVQAGGSTSATVTSGSTASYALKLAAGPGFSGSVSLSCSGAPANASCTITPSSLSVTSGGSANFSVAVTTSQQVAMGAGGHGQPQIAYGGFLLGALLLPIFSRRSRLPGVAIMLFALLIALPVAGCSGGSSAGGSSTRNVAPGSYQLVVSAAAGGVSTTQALTLVVQ